MHTVNTSDFPVFKTRGRIISVHLLKKEDLSSEIGRQVAQTYGKIFAQHPWYEQMRCVACEHNNGVDRQFPFYEAGGTQKCIRKIPEDGKCDLCYTALVDFWPEERILGKFHSEFDAYDFIAVYAKEQATNQILGFATGFVIAPMDLEKYLKLPSFAQSIASEGVIAYLSDLGVLHEFRQKGIARYLRTIRKELIVRQNPNSVIFRTRPDSITYKWYTQEDDFQIVDTYGRIDSNDPRVILMMENMQFEATYTKKE